MASSEYVVHVRIRLSGTLECQICSTWWFFNISTDDDVEELLSRKCRRCRGSLELIDDSVAWIAVPAEPPNQPLHGSTMIDKAKVIERILEREKGWNDRPDDPGNANGGATNWGWTLTQFRKVTNNPNATKDDLRALTREQAGELHWQEFYVRTRIAGIPNPVLAEMVADAAVQSGPRNAIRMLQRAMGFAGGDVDGILGTVTMHSIPAEGLTLARILLAERMEFLGRWAAGDLTDADKDGIPDRLENLSGVLNRVGKLMRSVA